MKKQSTKAEKILHWIAHILNWNYGIVHSELRGSEIWIGFKCSACGKIEGLHCADKAINSSQ